MSCLGCPKGLTQLGCKLKERERERERERESELHTAKCCEMTGREGREGRELQDDGWLEGFGSPQPTP